VIENEAGQEFVGEQRGLVVVHRRGPNNEGLPAVRYAIKQFMEEQAPSNFCKERWAASYDPARKVTYVSWFLGTIAYFLDKLDFTALVSPPEAANVASFKPATIQKTAVASILVTTRRMYRPSSSGSSPSSNSKIGRPGALVPLSSSKLPRAK
jgi:hypothetical protein